jgi:acyl-CoA reductase-like NAD-dependent aldehyde dehydrogenase
MAIDEKVISSIVQKVVSQLAQEGKISPPTSLRRAFEGRNGLFSDLEVAIGAAEEAQRRLVDNTLEKRKEIIVAIRQAALDNADLLGQMEYNETKMGRLEHKTMKVIHPAQTTPGMEILEPVVFTGDNGIAIEDWAPFGVIGAITPSTNPPSTVINNAIGMISAGDSLVVNPHPAAKSVTMKTIELLNQAIVKVGGPDNLLTSVTNPTIDTARALMTHPKIAILAVTGGPAVVKVAMSSGKKVIAAGPGNPPVVVDETADIRKAARDIVEGASFDNNIQCLSEKEIFVVNSVADELKAYMKQEGAYEISVQQLDGVMGTLFKELNYHREESIPSRDFVGRDAKVILQQIGITVGDEVRLVIVETDIEHPLVWAEQLMPVVPIVRVRDVDEGIKFAVEAERGCYHTAIMHSQNINNISKMAKLINTANFVTNAPSLAANAVGGEGYGTWTLTTTTGDGASTARNFARKRRLVVANNLRFV